VNEHDNEHGTIDQEAVEQTAGQEVVEQTEYTAEEMEALIDGTITDFDEGDLVSGTIVKVERDEVLLDIGYKSEGVIPARELSIRKDLDPGDIVKVGDEVEALVLQKEDKEGRLILSKKRAAYERAWSRIEEKFEKGEDVEGEVIEVVKGGLILDIGLRGFLPASLVDLRRVKDLSTYLDQSLEARVIEMDRNRNNVVLSRRVVLEEGRKHERAAILGKLAKGQILPGVVSSIVDFGAFVDLGGIDGLVHISELSWSHVNHPSEVVKVGDEVEVKVLDVDLDRERISLGLKQTQPDPWQELVKKYPVGEIIEGRVTKLVPFGAFVELGDGVEGLVHISEMAKSHVETPEQVTAVDAQVQVKVMDIDLDRRRISLSMQAAAEELGFEIDIAGIELPSDEESADEYAEDSSELVAEEAAEVAEEALDAEAEAETVEEALEAAEEAVEAEELAEAAEEVAEAELEVAEVAAEEAVEAEVVAEEAEELAEEALEAEAEAETVEEALEAAEEAVEAEELAEAAEEVAEAELEVAEVAAEEAVEAEVVAEEAEELAEEGPSDLAAEIESVQETLGQAEDVEIQNEP
jgi:small subunit ribosomal protein S1